MVVIGREGAFDKKAETKQVSSRAWRWPSTNLPIFENKANVSSGARKNWKMAICSHQPCEGDASFTCYRKCSRVMAGDEAERGCA